MKAQAPLLQHVNSKPSLGALAPVGLLVLALCAIAPGAAEGVDVEVGFYAPAYASNSASGSTSVAIGTTFPSSSACAFPAIAVRVAIRNPSAAQAPTVSSVTWQATGFSSQPLNNVTAGFSSTNESQRKRTEIYVLAGPNAGPGTATVTLSASADVIADVVAACAVNQTTPALPAGTNQATSSQTNDPGALAFSTKGGLVLDVLAIENGITATAASPATPTRVIDLNGVSVASNLTSYSSHYTDTTTSGFVFPRWNLSAADYWVDSVVVLQPYQPTRVELSSFEADVVGDGVQVSWRSGFEADNLGYRVYRELGGERVPVNDALIAGSALSFRSASLQAGYVYAWRDPAGQAGDRYWLESIDLSGRHEWHGPAVVPGHKRAAARALASSVLINAVPSVGAGSSAASTASRRVVARRHGSARPDWDRQAEIAAGEAAKIVVREDGWYRVGFDELRAAGFPVEASDAPLLRLYADGVEQAIGIVSAEAAMGPVAPEALEFYGTAVDTPYTDGRVYWLVKGDRPGARIQTSAASTFRVPSRVSLPYTIEHRERSFYVMGVINGERENFFGRFVGSDGVTQTLVADHLDADGAVAVVEVEVQGLGVEHRLEVSLNGAALGTLDLEPWQAGKVRLEVPRGLLAEGQNALELRSTEPNGYSLFDTVRLTYPRWSSADGDQLLMSVTGRVPRDVQIDNFSEPSVRVLDVSDAGRPMELRGSVTPSGSGFAVGVRTLAAPRLGGDRVLFAFSEGQVKRPASITANRPSEWRSSKAGADIVMITARTLESALAPLADLRRTQGHAVAVVDVEDVFDEYSFGMKSPAAVRSFLEDAAEFWDKAPRFVVLAGNATYDPRDYLGFGGDLVPTMHVDTAEMEAPSDDWFADFDGDGVAEMAVGRLPVESSLQAADVVEKLVRYETSAIALERALFVADAPIGSNFQSINSRILPELPSGLTADEVNVGEVGVAAAKAQLLAALDDGVGLVHYSGHGSVDHLRGDLLTVDDVASLGNEDRPALFTMMNCLVGMFDDPVTEALGKALVNSPAGGAVAVWASSGTTTAPDQEPLMIDFFKALKVGGEGTAATLGEAIAAAKAATSDGDVQRTWILLGDPATTVR